MAITRWPSLHRPYYSPTQESTNEEQSTSAPQTPLPVRRKHFGIQLPNPAFFSKFRRKSLSINRDNLTRRASLVPTSCTPRTSVDVDRTSVMPEFQVVFDSSEEGNDDGARISKRVAPCEPAEEDTEYRYWRLQGRSGRRNAEVGQIRKDWSSMASPFALQPKILDGGRYIEPPTLIRNYFDASTPSIISNMVEPYPLLRKQHAGHSVEHDDIDVSISPYRTHLNDWDTKHQIRHSLSWGNMDKMISENRHEEHALGRVDTDTSTSTAGTHSGPWGGMRKMMSGKGKKSKHSGDKKGKSRIIDIDLIPQTLEEESTESHTPADHPTIKILVQEPQISFHLESPIRQSNDFLHVVQRSTSPYDADVDSIDDHPSNTTKSLADSKEL